MNSIKSNLRWIKTQALLWIGKKITVRVSSIKSDNDKVLGDVYLIDPSIFPNLDEFEGDEYIRVKVKTSSDIECWVYEYKYDISPFNEIKGGDWMLR